MVVYKFDNTLKKTPKVAVRNMFCLPSLNVKLSLTLLCFCFRTTSLHLTWSDSVSCFWARRKIYRCVTECWIPGQICRRLTNLQGWFIAREDLRCDVDKIFWLNAKQVWGALLCILPVEVVSSHFCVCSVYTSQILKYCIYKIHLKSKKHFWKMSFR